MTRAPLFIFATTGATMVALGAALWIRFGDGVFFDWVNNAIVGCLF